VGSVRRNGRKQYVYEMLAGGHGIRFVEKDSEWWTVAANVYSALDIADPSMAVANMEKRLREAGVIDTI
jgi:prophage antirepressor-like protein